MRKLSKAQIVRPGFAVVLFPVLAVLLIDFLTMKRMESLLNESPKTVELEADLCNAFMDKAFFGTRFFIDRILEERKVKVKLLSGHCSKGTRSLVEIEQGRDE